MKRLAILLAILLCTTAFAQNKHNASTPKDPATIPLPPDKKGVTIDGKIENSTIYPGTKREFQVFVPQQYDGTNNHNHTPYGNMAFDTLGNLYIATPIGIQVCDQNGRVRAILPLPGAGRKVDALAFIGNKIYAKCGGKIFVRTFAHTGWNSWEAPIDVKSQGQG